MEVIPRQGLCEDSPGRAGLPLLLFIFHSFTQIFIVYHMPDIVLGVKDTAVCKTEKWSCPQRTLMLVLSLAVS